MCIRDRVGLGTDGASSNNKLDMFAEMRLAALIHKVKDSDPLAINALEALNLSLIHIYFSYEERSLVIEMG